MLVLGGKRYYAVGCYISPTNLTALTHVKAEWTECPKGHIPILLGDLNIKLVSPRNKQDELITKHVTNIMGLVDVSCQFKQHCRARAWGHWAWRMRQGGRSVSSQRDYFLRREIDRRRFCNISLQMPSHHDSDHYTIVAKIYSGAKKKIKVYRQRCHRYQIKLPRGPQGELETIFEELCVDVAPPLKRRDPTINGFPKKSGCSSINGWRWGKLGSSTSADPAS